MNNKEVNAILNKYKRDQSSIIAILQDIQEGERYLPRDVLEYVAQKLDISLSKIYYLSTFYQAFSLEPRGKHIINVCVGTACHVRGASRILDTVQEKTGIKPGETDLDLKFSLEVVNCLGCCALGPVMEIDGKTHGKMTPGETADVLKNYE